MAGDAWELEQSRRRAASRGRSKPRAQSRSGARAGLRPKPRSRSPIFEPAAPCICPVHGTEYLRWVQSTLNQVESAGLPVNGVMSAATRRALRKFQGRKGLLVDGIAGPEVEQALRDARRPTDAGAKADEPGQDQGEIDEYETLELEAPTRMPTLRRGSRGSGVADLQRRLGAAGFNAGAADAIFGSKTDAAVRAFQRARGLAVDGIVGSRTWGALLGTSPSVPGGGGSATNEWLLPASVRTAGEAQTVRYDSPPAWIGMPGNCTGTFTAGAAALKAHILATFAGVSSIGGYSCRANSANRSETSVHGTGRALDIMIPTLGGRANSAIGDPIANWLVRNAAAIGVQYIIWNRMRWSGSRTPRVARYRGPNPHIDHVHVELNDDGARRRTPWFQDHKLAEERQLFDDEFELEDEFRVASWPAGVREAFRMGPLAWSLGVQRAIQAGVSSLDDLTNLVFFMHHPERVLAGKGRALRHGEAGYDRLVKEWKAFRTLVAPLLKYPPKSKLPPTPAPATTEPVVVSDAQLRNKLLQASAWMEDHGGAATYGDALCLAGKLLLSGVDDGYIDKTRMDQFFRGSPRDLSTFVSSAKRVLMTLLRTRWETSRSVAVTDIVSKLREVARSMIEGMNLAYFQLTGVDVYDRARKLQVKHELGNRSRRKASLYNCRFAADHYGRSIATLP
ncbi:MAG: hypothetical protein CRU78_04065 [Candidatus Accumulibacter phosphatis]|uniref:Peptidoglycan-binding protein n=1 Tax=Candidatus Accumulibacter phosphatis TaxID=327160 RepID=A0A6A7RQC3_9PROT|nr:hypothetical protein [Candidatus Accumulibacter phosphatis]